ncbi:glycoside hydrolase family 3 domain protein, partial [mine drainage metagenome]
GQRAVQLPEPHLLTNVLRQEWDFSGFVTTDYTALHSLSGAMAGADVELPARLYGRPLQEAVAEGKISRMVINTMVAPVLDQLFRFNLINHPRSATMSAVASTAAHREISTRIAEAGTVLLKNAQHLLPLAASEKIVVIGPAASAQVTVRRWRQCCG